MDDGKLNGCHNMSVGGLMLTILVFVPCFTVDTGENMTYFLFSPLKEAHCRIMCICMR